MKQIILALCAALLITATTTSCEKNPFKVTYDFNISGHATGDVAVAFPGGSVDLEGNAKLDFNYGNLDTTSFCAPKLSKKQLNEIQKLANEEVYAKFSATAAEGTYYLLVDCVVTEETTGAEFRLKKVLTNEPQKD